MNKQARINGIKKISLLIPIAIATAISWNNNPVLAKDPFREKNPREIGSHTEQAFETIFLEGDYQTVESLLKIAELEEPDEPLAHAMQASLAYTTRDWEKIRQYALKTLESAQKLSLQDPLRGNLYLAVGHFLDGAYIYEKKGAIDAINKLQLVFKHLDLAEDIEPKDPELNLIKGYMDLFLAVNLPFSSPDQAIARFETNAAPKYLVERGLAVAYRDLKQYDKALEYVDKALGTAPENPEHFYLKGQILRNIGKQQENIDILKNALENFHRALAKSEQLPGFVIESLSDETAKTQAKIAEIEADRAAKK
ncbi:MAG: Sll0314/Alr1548 family TPR repeat-containing protein [Pleurocapsa sp.]